MTAPDTVQIPLPHVRSGKVRDVYDLGSELLMVASDRISAFDVIMPDPLPGKGIILNQLSAFWFEKLQSLVPNHMVCADDRVIAEQVGAEIPWLKGRCMIVRKCEPIAVECVARGYLVGSFWKEYAGGNRVIHGHVLPDGLRESDRLPQPIFTPATKAETGHDENISFEEMKHLVGPDLAELLRSLTLEIYRIAAEHAANSGLILADTKFEFGRAAGQLVWIDEALTPDSSRYWDAAAYTPGIAQPSFDKQGLRDYLETLTWDKQPPGPSLPAELIERLRERYLAAYQRLTGHVLAL